VKVSVDTVPETVDRLKVASVQEVVVKVLHIDAMETSTARTEPSYSSAVLLAQPASPPSNPTSETMLPLQSHFHYRPYQHVTAKSFSSPLSLSSPPSSWAIVGKSLIYVLTTLTIYH
jgi:hypothetical protein